MYGMIRTLGIKTRKNIVKILLEYGSTQTVIWKHLLGSQKKRRKQFTDHGNEVFKSNQRMYQTGSHQKWHNKITRSSPLIKPSHKIQGEMGQTHESKKEPFQK